MTSLQTRKLTYAALFLALAMVLPFLTAQIPEIGSMLSPMHIPVLLCGFLCGWPWGLAVGFIAPPLRSVLFGMPAMFPGAAAMAFELATYGAVSGLLVVFGVWLLDYKLHIDDPVGAVAVHCLNGIWGTIATGLFATSSAPGYSIANASGETLTGLFYGGGFELLRLQLLGLVAVAAWTAVTITIAFLLIKTLIGLRVTREEEITGFRR